MNTIQNGIEWAPSLLAPALLALLLAPPVHGQSEPARGGASGPTPAQTLAIDDLFAEWDQWDSPGASLAIAGGDDIVYQRGYGSAQIEYRIPITPRTVFHVASVSKQFTAYAAALLEQDGKLDLDDDVREYVPEVPDLGHTITLRHLANHTSGLRDQWELLAMAGWRLDDVITREHILRLVRRQRELNFEPGAEYTYSNTGYTLLGLVVERVSGMSFDAFCERRIFKPLGMTRTHFHDDHTHIVPNRAYSYGPKPDGGLQKSVLSYANAGATSLFTTAPDLARWLMHLDRPQRDAAAVEALHERGRLNDGKSIDYALGVSHGKQRGLTTVSHGGADAGFRSVVVRYPEHRLGIVVLSNLGSFNTGSVASDVAAILIGDQMEPLDESESSATEEVELSADELDRFVGSYAVDGAGVVVIARQGRSLFAQAPTIGRQRLAPTSKNEFTIAAVGAKITFERPEGGLDGLLPHQRFTVDINGQRFSGERVEPVSPKELSAYTGDYASAELATLYSIVLEDGRLVARHQRNDDVPLLPVARDHFQGNQWWFSTLRFERDEDDEITGLRVTGGRVRNLRFERVQGSAGLLSLSDG